MKQKFNANFDNWILEMGFQVTILYKIFPFLKLMESMRFLKLLVSLSLSQINLSDRYISDNYIGMEPPRRIKINQL